MQCIAYNIFICVMAFHNLRRSLPLAVPVDGGGAATAVILGILLCYFLWLLRQKRRISTKLPPGPYPWPIIGNLHQLRLPTHRTLKSLADKYGPILFLRLGSVPTVVVSSAEMAKLFLKTHDFIFASRPLTASGKLMFYHWNDVIFARRAVWRSLEKNVKNMHVRASDCQKNQVLQARARRRGVCDDLFNMGGV